VVRILKENVVRDGFWNGRLVAVPSEFLMSIGEEETAPVREDRGLVPEGWRVHVIEHQDRRLWKTNRVEDEELKVWRMGIWVRENH
jgi:hypothetical protein